MSGSPLSSPASPFPASASYSAGVPSPLHRCRAVEREVPVHSQRSLCKCKAGCRTYRQPKASSAGIVITRTKDEKPQACSKGNLLTPEPAPTMRACCLCTWASVHLLPPSTPRRTERLSHLLPDLLGHGRWALTQPYRDLAREISSWSPGVHMFKPIGNIFLSAATMREVWMEYKSPLRFVFFRSWSCPPD